MRVRACKKVISYEIKKLLNYQPPDPKLLSNVVKSLPALMNARARLSQHQHRLHIAKVKATEEVVFFSG